jgi:5-oxoprolinase (ATP-hydrolysing)
MAAKGFRLGVEVGGIFTDVCVITPEGRMVRSNVLTDTTDQSIGIKKGVDQVRTLLKEQEGWDGRFDYVHHGTPVGTNAILEGTGARAGLEVTAGHRDVLNFRRA